VVEGDGLLNR